VPLTGLVLTRSLAWKRGKVSSAPFSRAAVLFAETALERGKGTMAHIVMMKDVPRIDAPLLAPLDVDASGPCFPPSRGPG